MRQRLVGWVWVQVEAMTAHARNQIAAAQEVEHALSERLHVMQQDLNQSRETERQWKSKCMAHEVRVPGWSPIGNLRWSRISI